MDPTIWGPLLWHAFHDVAVHADRTSGPPADLVQAFYQAWIFLLPCKYCRNSYRDFVTGLPPNPPFKPWVYAVHQLVNQKLQKPTTLSYCDFLRRAEVYTAFGSLEDFLTVLYALALNYRDDDRPCLRTSKRKYLHSLVATLPAVLPYPHAASLFGRRGLRREDTVSQRQLVTWVYRKWNLYRTKTRQPALPPAPELMRQFRPLRAKQKPTDISQPCR